MTTFLSGVAIAVLSASAVEAAPLPAGQNPAEVASLQAAEDRLFQAELQQNVSAIDAALADDLVFVHATGQSQTKDQFLQSFQSGKLKFTSVSATNRVIEVWGDIGVVRGESDKVLGPMTLSDLYLAVYVRQDGQWKLKDWQTTPLSPPKPGGMPK